MQTTMRPIRTILSVSLAWTLAAALAAQGRPLTHDDYDDWKSLRSTAYSADGRWVATQIEPQFGDGVLVVRSTEGAQLHEVPRGSSPRFTADGRFVVFQQGRSKIEERDKKIEELRKKAKAAKPGAAAPAAAAEQAGGGGEGAGRRGPSGRGGSGRRPGGSPAAAAATPGSPGASGGEESARERGEWQVLDLATGKIESIGKAKSVLAPDDAAMLFVHREKLETKKDEEKEDDEKKAESGTGEGKAQPAAEPEPEVAAKAEAKAEGAKAEVAKAEVAKAEVAKAEVAKAEVAKAEGGGAEGEASAARTRPARDPLEAKRPEGTELVVRDLASGQERTIPDVVDFGVSRNGKWFWYHRSAKKPAEGASYGLFVEPLAGGPAVTLLAGIARVGSVTVDRSETAIAFTSDFVDFAAEKPSSDLYLWTGGAGPAQRIAWVGAPGMPPELRVGGGISFSLDGSALAFTLSEPPAPEPLPILPEDKVTLDLWNWRDGLLQTMQQKRGARGGRESRTAVWHVDTGSLVVLGDEKTPSLRFVGPDGARMLGSDSQPYEQEVMWDGRYSDVWLVNAVDGSRQRVLEKYRGNVTNSPGGRYLLWFGDDYQWWALDTATGERRDLTSGIGLPFHRHDDDHPAPDSPYGSAGWTTDDAAVLLYDEFDVWQVSPATGQAVCVTDGLGRQQRLRLRLQSLPRDDDSLWLPRELLLSAVHVDTMQSGFFSDRLGVVQKPQRLVLADCAFNGVTSPKKTTRLFYTRSTFRDYPDLWTANADFSAQKRLTEANPQQKQLRWGNSELVRWIDGNGEPRQGILIKPDGFEPTKKYPMMVYFYERMTQGLHNYVTPQPGTSPNAAYYVSNGYLWFMPDVVYQVGYPGESCVKCVVAGVQHLIAQGFVDEKAIGAAGHSWGGYQTAFLVTRTNIFKAVESGAPVSNMLSAYGGIRYESGMSRQFQYEQTQSRIGGTPWQFPLRYHENSPIHFADKVTTPVLILHNDQDGAVPWTQGIEYFTALKRLGKECYLFNYNGEGHGLRNRANQKDWTRRMSEYFDHHLKGAPAPKWMTEGVPFHERDVEKLPFAKSYIDAHVKPAPVKEAATEAAAEATPAEAAAGAEAGSGDAVAAPPARARAGRGGGGRGEGRGGRSTTAVAEAPAKLKAGDAAPAFALPDETGAVRSLADHRGRMLLVWFYPKADTPGCTQQACGLRDRFDELREQGVEVLGVSFDDAAANAAFRSKHELPFPLLSDADRTMALAYGAAADASARMARRVAVLVDGAGKVVKVWSRVDVKAFAGEHLAALPL
jgi:dipeptidyl aminopeptidase/acylaminoacyl peptidase/peroxiredoxin